MRPDCAAHVAVASPHGSGSPFGRHGDRDGTRERHVVAVGREQRVGVGEREDEAAVAEIDVEARREVAGFAVTQVAETTPGALLHAARSTPPQLAASATTRFGAPPGAVNTSVTT